MDMFPAGHEEEEKVSVVSLSEVIRWRRAVRELAKPYLGSVLAGPSLMEFSSRLTEKMEPKSGGNRELGLPAMSIYGAVSQTVSAIAAGRRVDELLLRQLSERIAGNAVSLRMGAAALSWNGQAHVEWILVDVLESVWHRTKFGKVGAILTLCALSGTPSGMRWEQFFSEAVLDRMARKLGLKAVRSLRRVHNREFVRAKFAGKLEPGEALKIVEYRERPALVAYNRQLVEARRVEARECPKDYRWPCTSCMVGYLECPLGTHRANWKENRRN